MVKPLGTSWKTSLHGYLIGLLVIVLDMLNSGQVLPDSLKDWVVWLIGVLIMGWGRYQKDHNVSHAPMPANAESVHALVKS